MELRVFGRTGMQLSVLGFGCGAVGGLMVRGDAPTRSAPSHARSRPASTTLTPRCSTATVSRKRILAAFCKS